MRVRAKTSIGGTWEGRAFFVQDGQEIDLPDKLASALIKAGQAEALGKIKVIRKAAARSKPSKV